MTSVSVIIPAYNAEKYLEQTLRSVLDQTLSDIEVIVVDDGSADGTPDIVSRFPSVRYHRQANAGVSAARNAGIRLAAADYVAFLDADDIWHPDKLEIQLGEMKRHPDVLLSRTVMEDTDFGPNWQGFVAPTRRWQMDESIEPTFRMPYFGTSTVMVRKDAALAIGGFDVRRKIAEDVDFYLRVLARNPRLLTLDDVLVSKREVPGSLGDDSAAGYAQLLDVYEKFLSDHPAVAESLTSHVIGEAYRSLHLAHARSLLRARKKNEARRELWCVLKYGFGVDVLGVWLRSIIK